MRHQGRQLPFCTEAASLTVGSVLLKMLDKAFHILSVSVSRLAWCRGNVPPSQLMDTPAWTVIGVGAALLAAVGTSFRSVPDEPRAQGRRIDVPGEGLRERMTHLEGFRDAVAGTRVV